ncbi:MAG: hypothetical protein JXB15_08915, partial [Anaerolineales bacterium]|nr:hypothetical protein [Anaerolineales bacterium]
MKTTRLPALLSVLIVLSTACALAGEAAAPAATQPGPAAPLTPAVQQALPTLTAPSPTASPQPAPTQALPPTPPPTATPTPHQMSI